MICRDRSFVPSPHVFEHVHHEPQLPTTQSTAAVQKTVPHQAVCQTDTIVPMKSPAKQQFCAGINQDAYARPGLNHGW